MTQAQTPEPPGAEHERSEAAALHRLLESQVRGLPPSAPPIARLVRAGRARAARRARLRAATALAACVAAACAALPLLHGAASRPAGPSAPGTAAATPSPTRSPTTPLGSGVLAGTAWSVRADVLGVREGSGARLICLRSVIGGVRVDQAGGPLADCSPLGAGGGEGIYVAAGTPLRLFVSYGPDGVASARATFADGTTTRARAVRIPGTSLDGFAIPLGPGQVLAVIDEFDSLGRPVHHETDWR
jgi:hypothetical protein